MTLGFEELLAMRIPETKIKAGVVLRCRRRLGSLVQQAVSEQNPDVAKQAYDEAGALPQTQTEKDLAVEGYILNGALHAGNSSILMCWKGTLPRLLKTLTEKEFNRGELFLEALRGREIENLTTFEIFSHESKRLMIMPHFSSNLELLSSLSVEDGHKLVSQISIALSGIHELGFNHMDVKPSNICIRENGDFVLVDLGSVVRRDHYSESTAVYVPRDFQEGRSHGNRYLADDRIDWLMLGVTVAEKVCKVDVGGLKKTLTIAEPKEEIGREFVELVAYL